MLLLFSEEVCGGTKFAKVENLRPHWVLMWLLNYGWIQHSHSANLPADTVLLVNVLVDVMNSNITVKDKGKKEKPR